MRPVDKIKILILLLLAAVVTSCSNSKRLPAGTALYMGANVRILDHEATRKERKVLIHDLAAGVRPRPNTKSLGFVRFKLYLYNFAGDPKKKRRIREWLRRKLGEEPVLASSVNLTTNKDLMVNMLENRGFFNAKATATMKVNKKKKATAHFDVVTGEQYIIDTAIFRNDSSQIAHDIDSDFVHTLLTKGSPYNLDVIKAERVRIDRLLKERGYFYFKPDYILTIADTSVGDHKVKMYVRLKHREIPEDAYNVYSINDIFIFANYRLRGNKQDTSKTEMVTLDNYNVIDRKKAFKPFVFSQAMVFEKGDVYSLDDQNTSLSRLVNMGTFKFVKNRFDPVTDSLLDVYYYLTPYPKKSLRFELGGLTQNDNRAGTKGSISWRNRNTFKGAEELVFKINGGFEAQYSGLVKQPTIYNFGAETDLSFPRFVIPFMDVQTLSRYLPRSVIKLKYNFESASDLLRISSYTASYGYNWKEGPHKEHQLYPLNFTYVRTDTLGSTTRLQSLYSNLVFNGIIIGPTYEFTYNSDGGVQKKNSIFFNGRVDLSGNILGLVQKADYSTNPKEIFGSTYAQYVKLQPDFRHYLRVSGAAVLASRIMLGIGIPYGNSASLPNIKQFWAGGNSDLRGFQSRLVGPGTFNKYTQSDSVQYIQTLGDMKLELNTELRQNIYKFLNAAIFVDAGNIWLYRDNPDFKGGTFSSNFYKELAVDAGFGLRFDFKILILRLDLGIPIRKPWLPENERWVIDKISFADKTWKKENMVFNIAIGYPF